MITYLLLLRYAAAALRKSLELMASILSAAPKVVVESAREIPVAYSVDVVVVGGSTAAVEAADNEDHCLFGQ